MTKVIAFSMWGNIKTYCIGCIRNVIIAKHLFKGWEVWIYYNASVPRCVIEWLSSQSNVKLFQINDNATANSFKESGQQGMIWRYYPLADENVDVLVCRDIDSRLSYYEFVQLERWLNETKNPKSVLSMIDGYERKNDRLVRGGTCAFRLGNRTIDICATVKQVFHSKTRLPFYSDERFLAYVLKKYGLTTSIKFVPRGVRDKLEATPTCDLFTVFVGEVLDENNNKIDKNNNHVWQNRRLNDCDTQSIEECIRMDDEKMIKFMKSINQ